MWAATALVSVGRHTLVLIAEALLILAVAVTIALGVAFATGGDAPDGAAVVQAGRGGSITVPDGVFGGTTTATVNPGGDVPALAKCFQSGSLVYMQYLQVDGNNQATFKLGPTMLWTSGDASCTAEEGSFSRNGRWRAVASTTFEVDG